MRTPSCCKLIGASGAATCSGFVDSILTKATPGVCAFAEITESSASNQKEQVAQLFLAGILRPLLGFVVDLFDFFMGHLNHHAIRGIQKIIVLV